MFKLKQQLLSLSSRGCNVRIITTLGTYRMPKKQQRPKQESEASAKVAAGAVSQNKKGDIVIQILAKPGAKHNSVTDISESGVAVQIAAPPLDGEANAELIQYLSKLLDVRKSDVSLERGSKSRNKSIVVSSTSIGIETILEKLRLAVDK